jgi:hypothetical protein
MASESVLAIVLQNHRSATFIFDHQPFSRKDTVKKRTRHLPIDQWSVLIKDHHRGFIDWAIFEANQARLDSNTRPMPHQAGGAVREGSALLQGVVTCGHCGRRLHVHYRGRNSTPGYHCAGKDLVNGRGVYCLNVGGMVIEQAVTKM